jgi:large subunit ribosomal protein L31e
MERVYVIPLRDVKNVKRTKRSPRAIRYVKEFIKKHMKADDIKLDSSVNEKIWERGIQKIPPKIKVKAVEEEDGTVSVTLAE